MTRAAGLGAALVAAFSIVMTSGCAGTRSGDSTLGSPGVPKEPPPAYADIRAAYNTRVERLERLWARVSLRLRGIDDQKQPFDEVVDGNLQIERPRRFSLLVMKLGSTYFHLGSNQTQFWWLDLYTKPYSALVGEHAAARVEDTAKFGLPVYPLDLMPLLGITPLGEEAPKSVAWNALGQIVIVEAGGTGERRLTLDARTMRPVLVELLGADGKAIVTARHSEYISVDVRGEPLAKAAIATRVALDFRQAQLKADVSLWDPENRPVRAELFDLAGMKDRYGVERETRMTNSASGTHKP